MSIFRINKTKNYTIMSNHHLKDKGLSYRAKGLLSVILSLPEDWDYSLIGLCKLSKEGRDSTNSALAELEKNKYLIRTQNKDKNGKFNGYNYDVYETPVENPFTGNPFTGKPLTENPLQLNTNELNTNNIYIGILNYLNEKCGTNFKPVESNLRFIKARINSGYKEEDLKKVVDLKITEWKGTDMQKYLRPETLFNATKFESYFNGLKDNKGINHGYHQKNYTKEELENSFDDVDEVLKYVKGE